MSENAVTIMCMVSGSMISHEGRKNGAKLAYQADGLNIYVIRETAFTKVNKTRLDHFALTVAIDRSIPAIAVRDVSAKPRKKKTAPKNQPRLL